MALERNSLGSLQAIAEVVNKSAECNYTQLVSRDDGSTIVTTFDWTDFFAPRMKRINGIKKYHHFRIFSSSPGTVFVKEQNDTPEVELILLKEPWDVDSDTLPNIVPPHGLSIERQWYLYERIRPFCPDEDKDTVCLLPSSPKPGGSRWGTPHPEAPTPSHPEGEMPAATQPLHLNTDGSVVCVMRLGIIKEVALTSITPQLRTYFICNPLPVFLYLVCMYSW